MNSKVRFDDHELTTNNPEGDPSKMKNWGYISAKPSEFLIVYRNGELMKKVCGQGARFFKWPSDTVAIVPTTLKEVIFQANQITIDNVDVRLRGMVLYRVRDPLRIYKLINFSFREQAEAKLARVIADMCRSTAKWLVANMKVEECVRRRKEEIAAALRKEVSSVVSSDGPEGWGVEIVTIDIQDIFIQDAELFAAMQAKFKAEKEREAQLARLEVERDLERRRIDSAGELARERHQIEIQKRQLDSELQLVELSRLKKRDEEQFLIDRFRVEENEKIQRFKLEQDQDRERIRAEAAQQRAGLALEQQRAANDESVRALRERLAAENAAGPAALERLFLEESLPELAKALGASLSGARFNVYSGAAEGGSPMRFALDEIMSLMRERLARGSSGAAPS